MKKIILAGNSVKNFFSLDPRTSRVLGDKSFNTLSETQIIGVHEMLLSIAENVCHRVAVTPMPANLRSDADNGKFCKLFYNLLHFFLPITVLMVPLPVFCK